MVSEYNYLILANAKGNKAAVFDCVESIKASNQSLDGVVLNTDFFEDKTKIVDDGYDGAFAFNTLLQLGVPVYLMPGATEKATHFDTILSLSEFKDTGLVNILKNRVIKKPDHELVFLPGQEYADNTNILLTTASKDGFWIEDAIQKPFSDYEYFFDPNNAADHIYLNDDSTIHYTSLQKMAAELQTAKNPIVFSTVAPRIKPDQQTSYMSAVLGALCESRGVDCSITTEPGQVTYHIEKPDQLYTSAQSLDNKAYTILTLSDGDFSYNVHTCNPQEKEEDFSNPKKNLIKYENNMQVWSGNQLSH